MCHNFFFFAPGNTLGALPRFYTFPTSQRKSYQLLLFMQFLNCIVDDSLFDFRELHNPTLVTKVTINTL